MLDDLDVTVRVQRPKASRYQRHHVDVFGADIGKVRLRLDAQRFSGSTVPRARGYAQQ